MTTFRTQKQVYIGLRLGRATQSDPIFKKKEKTRKEREKKEQCLWTLLMSPRSKVLCVRTRAQNGLYTKLTFQFHGKGYLYVAWASYFFLNILKFCVCLYAPVWVCTCEYRALRSQNISWTCSWLQVVVSNGRAGD